ncbi:hypothetical protein BCR35DRAFT_298652 [Leucosporidium creatinivorum]|uniref:Uncharacterized protein n=1 Tax=Leucosporidium creatinivorum TaxID=106004 RepID=A0A1Y2G673_9BASI|nr:hypothetical protein BCR35DRAFT_298652 [Leucosporidium creatinivorum]
MEGASNEQRVATSSQIELQTPAFKDHLSSLPPELLRPIFHLTQEDGPQPLAPLNRSLLSLGREALFERVVISSSPQLELFVEAVRAGAVGGYIEQLELEISQQTEDGEETIAEIVGSEDGGTPSDEALVECFAQLNQLTSLKVIGSSRIAALVLSYRVARSSLPALGGLTLAASFKDWSNPFNPEHYKQLGRYGGRTGLGLDYFDITILRDIDSITETPPSSHPSAPSSESQSVDESPGSTVSAEQVESLEATEAEDDLKREDDEPEGTDEDGYSFASTDDENFGVELPPLSAARVAGPLSHPFALDLADLTRDNIATIIVSTSPLPSFRPFLEPTFCPELLRSLILRKIYGGGGLDPLDDLLLSFTALEELELAKGTFSPSLFTQILPTRPISRLVFGLEAEVTSQQLLDLVHGPQRLSSLKVLCLDVVNGTKGTAVGMMPYLGTEDWLYPDWILPRWPEGLTRRSVEELVRIAEKEGIRVEGTTLEAMKVEDAHEEELDWVNMMRIETWGDYEDSYEED